MVAAFVKKPYPIHTPERFEEFVYDNHLIKTMHLLAQDYEGLVYFSWVNTALDEDLIAASLNLDQRKLPTVLLIHENQVFEAPQDTLSYAGLAQFIEGGYFNHSVTLVPLSRRLDMLRYVVKMGFRALIDVQ